MLLYRDYCATCCFVAVHQIRRADDDYYLQACTLCAASRKLPAAEYDQAEAFEADALIQRHSAQEPALERLRAPGDAAIPPPRLLAEWQAGKASPARIGK